MTICKKLMSNQAIIRIMPNAASPVFNLAEEKGWVYLSLYPESGHIQTNNG